MAHILISLHIYLHCIHAFSIKVNTTVLCHYSNTSCPEKQLSDLCFVYKSWNVKCISLTHQFCIHPTAINTCSLRKWRSLLMWWTAAAVLLHCSHVLILYRAPRLKYISERQKISCKRKFLYMLLKTKQLQLSPLHTCSEWPHIHYCSILCPSLHSLLLGCCSLPLRTQSSLQRRPATHSPPSPPEEKRGLISADCTQV